MKKDKSLISKIIPITAAIFLALISVAYIIVHVISNQRHDEKWNDYNECGIQ